MSYDDYCWLCGLSYSAWDGCDNYAFHGDKHAFDAVRLGYINDPGGALTPPGSEQIGPAHE